MLQGDTRPRRSCRGDSRRRSSVLAVRNSRELNASPNPILEHRPPQGNPEPGVLISRTDHPRIANSMAHFNAINCLRGGCAEAVQIVRSSPWRRRGDGQGRVIPQRWPPELILASSDPGEAFLASSNYGGPRGGYAARRFRRGARTDRFGGARPALRQIAGIGGSLSRRSVRRRADRRQPLASTAGRALLGRCANWRHVRRQLHARSLAALGSLYPGLR